MSSPHLSTTLSAARTLDELRARIRGHIILPADIDYHEARSLEACSAFTTNRFPSVIVRTAGTADVAEAVKFARVHGIPLSVRGGGHSVAGFSVQDGTLVVDMSEMRDVEIDPERQIARVQGGARSIDLAVPAHELGLALSTGDTGTVGFGGLVTGGGVGWFVRKYGIAADRLLSAEIVTADGNVVRASNTENADLFWAIRGGGGNFGIITRFEFQLVPVKYVYGGALLLPATREVVRGYLEYTVNAPDELSTAGTLTYAPPAPFVPEDKVGERVLLIIAVWSGNPAEGEQALAPLRALGEPIADTIATIPYPGIFQYMEWAQAPHGSRIRMMFTDEMPDTAIDDMVDAIENTSSPFNALHMRGLGGQLARIPADSTAFAHRDKKYFVAVMGLWFDPEDNGDAHRAWADDIWAKISHLRKGVYVNFMETEGESRIREAYPDHVYRRLAAVKAKYDPDNVFHFNQNIRPAQQEGSLAA